MSLAAQLKLAHPLVWVVSNEPHDVLADLMNNLGDRKLYRWDSLKGLVEFNPEKGWLIVLLSDDGLATSLGEALLYVMGQRGVFFIEHAHRVTDSLVSFLTGVYMQYMDSVYADNKDKVPLQVILVSYDEQIPPEISKITTKVRFPLPDDERLVELSRLLGASENLTRIARAGAGLTTNQFIRAATTSLVESKEISFSFINNEKVRVLAEGSSLKLSTPKVGLDSLGGMDLLKSLVKSIVWTWENPDKVKQLGVTPMRRIMAIGVSGSGKSLSAECISSALGLDLAKFGVSQAMSKWVGESERHMREAFEVVHRLAPVCLWVDEAGRDLSGGSSSSEVDGGTTDRVHGEFLTGMQELPDNVFFVAAANRIDSLPPEMTRADRFDKILFFGFPTHEERREIFGIHLTSLVEGGGDYDLDQLAGATSFFTGAEIKALIKEVTFETVTTKEHLPTTADIVAFAPKVKGRVWINHRDSISAMYTKAKTYWAWASSSQEAEADKVLSISGTTAPGQLRPRSSKVTL